MGKRYIRENYIIKVLMMIFPVLLTSIYMPIFMYTTNSAEVNFVEVIIPLGIFLSISFVICGMAWLLTKSVTKAVLVATIFTLLLENYHYLEKGIQVLIPAAKYWHVLPMSIFVVLHLCYVVCVVLKEETRKIVCEIVGIVMGAMIVVNFIGALPNILAKNSVDRKTENSLDAEHGVANNSMNDGANMYYFLLDEAAPFNVIEDYYECDMEEMRAFLNSNSFVISEGSYNDSTNTEHVLTNLLNLDYVVDDSMSVAQLNTLRSEATLTKVLKDNGYMLYGIGDTSWLCIDSLTTNQQASAETIDGRSFKQILMDITFLYPLWEKNYSEEQKIILESFDFFSGDIYRTDSEFKFVYICCPHQPFLFDENGKINSTANYNNWSDEKFYLGQYKFVMKKMQETITNIIEHDPESIIIVASDHGPRFNPEIPYEKMKNVLQAVYFKGEKIEELRNLSGVNTLRYILEKQLGVELPLVEVPQ